MEHKENKIIKEIIKKYTSEDYDPEKLGRFQEWLLNPVNKKDKNDRLFEIWSQTEASGDRLHAEKVFVSICERIGLKREEKKYTEVLKKIIRAAAVIILPLFIITALWLYKNNVNEAVPLSTETIKAVTEEIEKYLLLGDGSEVWIKNEGKVIVDGERENTLVGDALYNVKREYLSGKRFKVKTEHLTATVLGTIFRITAMPDSDETVITLYEGTLEIGLAENKYEIYSGTRFTYNSKTGEHISEDIGSLWPEQIVDKVIVYQSRDMGSVFNEIGKLYNVTVDFGEYSWASETVTFKFSPATNLENVMYMLSGISGNLNYKITDDKIYIYNKY